MEGTMENIVRRHVLWLETSGNEGTHANLSGSNLQGANLQRANLSTAHLVDAILHRARLYRAVLYQTNLSCAALTHADLYYANLAGANLSHANLSHANLSHANLSGADLQRANLSGADLSHANLTGVNLHGVTGDMRYVKSLACELYPVAYTSEVMQIGCERHPMEDWWGFDDACIIEMDGMRALSWWQRWKPILRQIVSTSPARPTRPMEGEQK